MIISKLSAYNPCFKSASLSINALSDTHGELGMVNSAADIMHEKSEDIFFPEKKGNANVLAVVGDWFIDGGKKGYLSAPERTMNETQAIMLNAFIKSVKQNAKNLVCFFTPGNHEFDGGVKAADKTMASLDAEIVLTNADIKNSPGLENCRKNGNIVNEKILEIDDDKNPDMKHKVLFLGIMPVNLKYYQADSDSIIMPDNIPERQAVIRKEQYKNTLEDCKARISKFKKENPNGHVILLNHTGVNFADNLAKESQVDLVFDGHEHKEDIRKIKETTIIPLSMNFQKIANAKLKFDDNGDTGELYIKTLKPKEGSREGELTDLYHELFKKDLEPVFQIVCEDSLSDELSEKDVRTGNNRLANFITDSILAEIKKIDRSVDFFALNSSSIRHSLKVGNEKNVSSFDVMNTLVGITTDDGMLLKTEVTGKELAYMVADNIMFNRYSPEKNSIIQYGGLAVNRTEMLKILNEKEYKAKITPEYLTRYITDLSTGNPIYPGKKYVIANPVKYFNKVSNQSIREMKDRSKEMKFGVHQLLLRHFTDAENGIVYAKNDVRIY